MSEASVGTELSAPPAIAVATNSSSSPLSAYELQRQDNIERNNEQLRALGVFEALALMTQGFPTRVPYADVHARFASRGEPRDILYDDEGGLGLTLARYQVCVHGHRQHLGLVQRARWKARIL